MRKTTDIFLLLEKAQCLATPDPHGSGATVLLDAKHLVCYLIHGLIV